MGCEFTKLPLYRHHHSGVHHHHYWAPLKTSLFDFIIKYYYFFLSYSQTDRSNTTFRSVTLLYYALKLFYCSLFFLHFLSLFLLIQTREIETLLQSSLSPNWVSISLKKGIQIKTQKGSLWIHTFTDIILYIDR